VLFKHSNKQMYRDTVWHDPLYSLVGRGRFTAIQYAPRLGGGWAAPDAYRAKHIAKVEAGNSRYVLCK
jgi:hypothetical protein